MTGGIFAVLDDIAMLMDDVAIMSKVAAKKTAGILGDDLAVNADKAIGFSPSRELPVLWEITKGSFINKLIILPLAFLLSAYASWLIVPVLLIGGCYLCFEGIEKVFHTFSKKMTHHPNEIKKSENKDIGDMEKTKIKSAVRTDFILSIEIVMIALGTVINENFLLQIIVVSVIALLATVGVYGIVAVLVRMDDMGFYLIRMANGTSRVSGMLLTWVGKAMVSSLPHVIRGLGIVGTIAMVLVGGGMFTHNIPFLHDVLHFIPSIIADLCVGTMVGIVLVSVLQVGLTLVRRTP